MDQVTDELDALRFHWGEAYDIYWIDGQFHAKRRDNGAMTHAPDAEQMFQRIRADYEAMPVPRDPRLRAL